MLPNLSDRWGASLQLMVPIASGPESMLPRAETALGLKKVDTIRISFSGKASQAPYAVEVFQANASGLSVARTGSEASTLDMQIPIIRIEKTLDDFKELRNKVHRIVHFAHRSEYCEFCDAVLDWVVFGKNPDGFFLPLISGERVARKLTKFVTDLLKCIFVHNGTDTQVRHLLILSSLLSSSVGRVGQV